MFKRLNSMNNVKKKNDDYPEQVQRSQNTFSERKILALEGPDSPTMTYEKRLFGKKSFDAKANPVNF